jgi:hypothetical protein
MMAFVNIVVNLTVSWKEGMPHSYFKERLCELLSLLDVL